MLEAAWQSGDLWLPLSVILAALFLGVSAGNLAEVEDPEDEM
jgi:hypothetical protein